MKFGHCFSIHKEESDGRCKRVTKSSKSKKQSQRRQNKVRVFIFPKMIMQDFHGTLLLIVRL
jgi:hypothetical protein